MKFIYFCVFISINCSWCGSSAQSVLYVVLVVSACTGRHDPRHANIQSHDAIWLRPDTSAGPEHQQSVYTGGTAEATTAAATAGAAGQHRYNTHYCYIPFITSQPYFPIYSEKTILIKRSGTLLSVHIISPGLPGTSGQTPQLFHSQTVAGSTTTALPGNTPLYNTPLTPMTPITPATPASESSGIVPQLQYVSYAVGRIVRLSFTANCDQLFWKPST